MQHWRGIPLLSSSPDEKLCDYSATDVNGLSEVGVEPTIAAERRRSPVLKLSRFKGVSAAGARWRNPERSRGNSLAEASGSRTHHRRRKTAIAGFEDRDNHRVIFASIMLKQLGLYRVPD
jgi:hypothetical protein